MQDITVMEFALLYIVYEVLSVLKNMTCQGCCTQGVDYSIQRKTQADL